MLDALQHQLQDIYEVETPHNVTDFLVTDPEVVAELDREPSRDVQEKLLVAQSGDNVDLALYLDREVLDRLREQDPTERLHDGNLADFWTVMEGVSHFLYVVSNATWDKSVTLLELEMQAEVDKYVAAALTVYHQAGVVQTGLYEALFEDPQFDAALDEHTLDRYRDANRFAAKFCRTLDVRSGLPELRRFYRLTQADKIRHIESA